MTSAYTENLDRNPANYQPLSPLGFLARAAQVFPDYPAVVHGARAYNYAEFYERSRRLASALTKLGIGKFDTVSVMFANTPAMLEAKFGVPMTGAVLHSMNTRLDAANIAFMIDHAETKVLITDTVYAKVVGEALALAKRRPIVIDYADPAFPVSARGFPKRNTRILSRAAIRSSPGNCLTTNGTRSRSTTPRARLATRRASSIIIAAPTS